MVASVGRSIKGLIAATQICLDVNAMPAQLIVPLIIGFAIVLAAVVCVVKARQLPIAIRILANLVFTLFALFCAFGFAAALEPGDDHVIWRVGYAIIFVACLFAIGRLLVVRSNSGND